MGHALKTAIFKIVGEADNYKNADAVEKVIKYVLKREKGGSRIYRAVWEPSINLKRESWQISIR